ncbi:MAG: hypothetical protein HKP42_04915, partial [Maribacter sp.]|nr:hypothetical protein [Maribacter sp.]
NFTFCILFVLSVSMLQAQQIEQHNIQKGDVLTIEEPSASDYRYVHFPRKNFIIKRGGIADMKTVIGKKVEITDYTYTSDGSTEVTLKLLDGKKFFRKFPTIKANLEDAISSGELTD